MLAIAYLFYVIIFVINGIFFDKFKQFLGLILILLQAVF